MQITSYTDYALRVLMFIAKSPTGQTTITEIADFFNISRNHLVKVVHQLGSKGFVKTTRGKGGGLALQRPPEMINIGDVVEHGKPLQLGRVFWPSTTALPVAAKLWIKAPICTSGECLFRCAGFSNLGRCVVRNNDNWFESSNSVRNPQIIV